MGESFRSLTSAVDGFCPLAPDHSLLSLGQATPSYQHPPITNDSVRSVSEVAQPRNVCEQQQIGNISGTDREQQLDNSVELRTISDLTAFEQDVDMGVDVIRDALEQSACEQQRLQSRSSFNVFARHAPNQGRLDLQTDQKGLLAGLRRLQDKIVQLERTEGASSIQVKRLRQAADRYTELLNYRREMTDTNKTRGTTTTHLNTNNAVDHASDIERSKSGFGKMQFELENYGLPKSKHQQSWFTPMQDGLVHNNDSSLIEKTRQGSGSHVSQTSNVNASPLLPKLPNHHGTLLRSASEEVNTSYLLRPIDMTLDSSIGVERMRPLAADESSMATASSVQLNDVQRERLDRYRHELRRQINLDTAHQPYHHFDGQKKHENQPSTDNQHLCPANNDQLVDNQQNQRSNRRRMEQKQSTQHQDKSEHSRRRRSDDETARKQYSSTPTPHSKNAFTDAEKTTKPPNGASTHSLSDNRALGPIDTANLQSKRYVHSKQTQTPPQQSTNRENTVSDVATPSYRDKAVSATNTYRDNAVDDVQVKERLDGDPQSDLAAIQQRLSRLKDDVIERRLQFLAGETARDLGPTSNAGVLTDKRSATEPNSPIKKRFHTDRSQSVKPLVKPAFVAAKSTTASHSVNVNLQQLLATLKSQNPQLHQLCLRMGPSTSTDRLAAAFHDQLSRNIDKLEAQLEQYLREYDAVCQKLDDKSRDADWDDVRSLLVTRIERTDTNIQRAQEQLSKLTATLSSRPGACRAHLQQCKLRHSTLMETKPCPKRNTAPSVPPVGNFGKPTLSSLEKSTTSKHGSLSKGLQSSSKNAPASLISKDTYPSGTQSIASSKWLRELRHLQVALRETN